MKKLNKKGFTLVELLAVIVILALLMVVAASVMGNVQENARKNSLKTETQKLVTSAHQEAQSAYMLDSTNISTNASGFVAEGGTAATCTNSSGTSLASWDNQESTCIAASGYDYTPAVPAGYKWASNDGTYQFVIRVNNIGQITKYCVTDKTYKLEATVTASAATPTVTATPTDGTSCS